MEIFSKFNGFEWDDSNHNKNWVKHRVTWGEREEEFFNQPLYIMPDPLHTVVEERFYALGRTNSKRLLFLVFTRRKSKLRVMAARNMHKRERKIYNEKTQKDSKI
jgi:uncharacterized DUF497 family protein